MISSMKNAKVNDLYRDESGKLWMVTGKKEKNDIGDKLDNPIIFIEQIKLPNQRGLMQKKVHENNSEIWKGFKKLGIVYDAPKIKIKPEIKDVGKSPDVESNKD